jgi:RHS repeat-associated protein
MSAVIIGGINRFEFVYGGLGRRVKILEMNNGSVFIEKRFVWEGMTIVQERNGFNSLQKRYYPEGRLEDNGYYGNPVYPPVPLYYTRDHLGSIRGVTSPFGSGVYLFDAYGRYMNSDAIGDDSYSTSFGYTGHYEHGSSGLTLAPYRAYDRNLGRWLSRDPIGEDGGINLYAYVLNSPISLIDPTGEAPADWADSLDGYLNTAQDAYTTDRHWVWDGTVGTAGDLLRGISDVLRFGDGTGRAVYDPCLDGVGRGGAVVQDCCAERPWSAVVALPCFAEALGSAEPVPDAC